jgi:hypothetical protein
MSNGAGSNITLDEAHQTMMAKHRDNEERVPELAAQLEACKEKLKTTSKSKNIDEYMSLKDKIKELSKTIQQLQNSKKNYLLKNAADIFSYFEEKQKISLGVNTQNTNILNSFFKIKSASAGADINPDKYSQSKKQYKYWKNINMEDVHLSLKNFTYSYDVCTNCGRGEMIHQDEEGVLICNNKACGHYIEYIIEGCKPNNKDPPNEVSYTAYIRLNHFKEILSQFQAKETTYIPPDVIQRIKDRIRKERIDIKTQLNPQTMREILRKLKENKYFEHIQYINSLIGISPPLMNDKLTDTLCVLFIEIQQPWALYCPPERVNFFNYSYILYQLCVLLDQKQYLPYITLLKNDTKQKQQDDIWKQVCRDLDWAFFPTV